MQRCFVRGPERGLHLKGHSHPLPPVLQTLYPQGWGPLQPWSVTFLWYIFSNLLLNSNIALTLVAQKGQQGSELSSWSCFVSASKLCPNLGSTLKRASLLARYGMQVGFSFLTAFLVRGGWVGWWSFEVLELDSCGTIECVRTWRDSGIGWWCRWRPQCSCCQ